MFQCQTTGNETSLRTDPSEFVECSRATSEHCFVMSEENRRFDGFSNYVEMPVERVSSLTGLAFKKVMKRKKIEQKEPFPTRAWSSTFIIEAD